MVAETTKAETPAQVLKRRGIEQAAQDALWEESSFNGQSGWKYPVFNFSGKTYSERRWKNSNSHGHPKYAWMPSKPEKARYYLLPDALEAIRKADGVCYLASGEPDVLAYRSVGIHNVLSWFDGETSVPESLVSDLTKMGATTLIHYPDRDLTGMRSSWTIFEKLNESEIEYLPYALKLDVAEKGGYDVNAFWIDCHFDKTMFHEKAALFAQIDESILQKYKPAEIIKPDFNLSSESIELPEAFKECMIRDAEKQKGFRKWDRDGWGNFCCPLDGENTPSCGYNRISHSFKCFKCGDMSAKEYGEKRGIFLRDFFEKSESAPKSSAVPDVKSAVAVAAPVIEVVQFMDSHEAISELLGELRGERTPELEPMLFPFSIYHSFGGFAEYIWQGKLVFVSGVSGGGKTAFGETLYIDFLKQGKDIIWYGPEWSPVEMALRNLQRMQGLSVNMIAGMRVYRSYERRGVPKEQRRGIVPPTAAVEASVSKLEDMLRWSGRAHYVRQGNFDLDVMLEKMEVKVNALREAGRNPSAMFFDYLQRAPGSGRHDWNWGELVVGKVKSFCERKSLFGFMFVQPTKGASRSTRDGNELNEASGQGVSDQQCNLYITITPMFKDKMKQDFSKVSIVKNSMGRTGWLYQRSPLQHLTWLDEEIPKDEIDNEYSGPEDDVVF